MSERSTKIGGRKLCLIRFEMRRRAALISMAMVAATGMVLRLWPIDAHSFWLDEAYSWTMATKFSFSKIVRRTANDFHPPLYFMILKCWSVIFGESEIAQRLLSVTCDVLTILTLPGFCSAAFAETHDAAKNCASRTIGVLAAALYAVNGIHIHWSIETRMYSMATLLSVVSSWLLLRGIQSAAHFSVVGGSGTRSLRRRCCTLTIMVCSRCSVRHASWPSYLFADFLLVVRSKAKRSQ